MIDLKPALGIVTGTGNGRNDIRVLSVGSVKSLHVKNMLVKLAWYIPNFEDVRVYHGHLYYIPRRVLNFMLNHPYTRVVDLIDNIKKKNSR